MANLNCVVSGPGITCGSVDTLTYFVLEPADKSTVLSMISIRITGPTNEIPTKITDRRDGTFVVEYQPAELGNHLVQVFREGSPFIGSPFQVFIKQLEDKVDPPNSHWFYEGTRQEGLHKMHVWVAFDDETSDEIERKFQKHSGVGGSDILFGKSHIDFNDKFERSNSSPKIKRRILRGTWFYENEDGAWAPYEEEAAKTLEKEFQSGHFKTVNVTEKPPRIVVASPTGMKQLRLSKKGNPVGRPVVRGYPVQ